MFLLKFYVTDNLTDFANQRGLKRLLGPSHSYLTTPRESIIILEGSSFIPSGESLGTRLYVLHSSLKTSAFSIRSFTPVLSTTAVA